jgi:hypothetical protein
VSPKTSQLYFRLWRDVCAANGWKPSDNERRKATITYCMQEVRGPVTDSSKALGPHEVTALLTLMRHLAAPDDLNAAGEWLRCKQDYKRYNHVRQARHFRDQAGYQAHGKLDRDRFDGKVDANFPHALPSVKETRDMLVTFASRARNNAEVKPEAPAAQAPAVRVYQMKPATKFKPQPKQETGANPF